MVNFFQKLPCQTNIQQDNKLTHTAGQVGTVSVLPVVWGYFLSHLLIDCPMNLSCEGFIGSVLHLLIRSKTH